MPQEEYGYQLSFDDFDTGLLPPDARSAGSDSFRDAVPKYLAGQYREYGGQAHISMDDTKRLITVKWSPDPTKPDPQKLITDYLARRQFSLAIPLIDLLRRHQPANPQHPYCLGMAYSEMGQFERATSLLQETLLLDPGHVNALVALGVAEVRAGNLSVAIKHLTEAVRRSPDNPWARRNLGGCLAKADRLEEAEAHLRRAVELLPSDEQAVFGLGHVLDEQGKSEEADAIYIQLIERDPTSQAAALAKEARARLAEKSFHAAGSSTPRPDAVMYLVGAMERFAKMTPEQVQKLGMEIAVAGMGGLDTNSPAQKYSLKSLPGKFSGLQLVCMMYAAFKVFAPDQDIGFDLIREYAVAQTLRENPKN